MTNIDKNPDKGHDHNHGHNHNHSHDHSHDHNHDLGVKHNKRNRRSGVMKIKLKNKNAPGVIYIERNIHDGAIVISGTLTVVTGDSAINVTIAKELETAAHEITALGGIVGHIKASSVVTSTSMISITDEEAMIKDSPECIVKITLAAIVFLVEPEAASQIMRKALASVRAGA